jgi:Alpha-L-fucosidase
MIFKLTSSRRDILKFAGASALISGQLRGQSTDAGEVAADVLRRTQWFFEAKWGVMIDCLGSTGLPVKVWNERIDGFDVENLASQLATTNIGYVFLTTGQNSGHFLAPNAVYDQLVGEVPSKCSRRDLMLDLGNALKKRNIRLIAYMGSDPPAADTVAKAKLQYRRGGYPNREYQESWQKVIQFYSDRWGKAVSGWWFDGCYWANAMYRGKAPNFETFADAARHGNADSIVAFNTGVKYPATSVTPFEDYTAGETNDPSLQTCHGRWIDGENWHMLSYLGPGWTQGPPRFDDLQAAKFTTKFVSQGGNVTWDVQTNWKGAIDGKFMTQLSRIGSEVAKFKR